MKKLKSHITGYSVALCMLLPAHLFAQTKTYHFSQADSLQKTDSKILMVFVHTNWCKFYAGMNASTFKNKEVIEMIKKNFYFIDLDAEDKKSIFIKGHTFRYKQTGSNTGIHELAEQLATIDNTVSYPTICYLNEQYEIIYQQTGFIKAKEILSTLTLLSEGKL